MSHASCCTRSCFLFFLFPTRFPETPGFGPKRPAAPPPAGLSVKPGCPQPRTAFAPRRIAQPGRGAPGSPPSQPSSPPGKPPLAAAGTPPPPPAPGPVPAAVLPYYRRCRGAGWAPGWGKRRWQPRTVHRAGPGRGRAGRRAPPPATCCAALGRAARAAPAPPGRPRTAPAPPPLRPPEPRLGSVRRGRARFCPHGHGPSGIGSAGLGSGGIGSVQFGSGSAVWLGVAQPGTAQSGPIRTIT